MSPALANFLFEAVNFLLLAAALGWILFRPVRAALDREQQRQATHDDEQARLREEAESLRNEARAVRTNAEHEAAARRDELLAAASREADRIVAAARRDAANEQRAFEAELANRQAGEAAALTDTLARITADSVRRMLANLAGPDLDAALVRAACAEIEQLPSASRSGALVESARRLDPGSHELLEHALASPFEQRVVGELGAGVRITTSAGQIDATATAIARQAAAGIKTRDVTAGTPRVGAADG